jgi:hypothetical protein
LVTGKPWLMAEVMPMSRCPDCGGTGLVTVVDPIANYADVGGGVSVSPPVPCPRCKKAEAVPTAASQGGRESPPKKSWWGRLFG